MCVTRCEMKTRKASYDIGIVYDSIHEAEIAYTFAVNMIFDAVSSLLCTVESRLRTLAPPFFVPIPPFLWSPSNILFPYRTSLFQHASPIFEGHSPDDRNELSASQTSDGNHTGEYTSVEYRGDG